MSGQLAVLIIHGMGDPPRDFAAAAIAQLRTRLGPLASRVELEPCFWSDILQPTQDHVWQGLQRSPTGMALSWVRRFVVSSLGDPVGYLSGYLQQGAPVYRTIHERVRARLATLASRLTHPDDTPLVVLAHSLGSVVVSNYVWNEERDRGEVVPSDAPRTTATRRAEHAGIGRTPFERMETLTTFVTFGSNIPVFLPPVPTIECIRFPRATLPERYRAVARWLNVYDRYDVLGYPLATVWDDLHGTRIDDVPLDAGPWPLSKTPLSHTWYLKTPAFLDLVEGEMRRVLGVAP